MAYSVNGKVYSDHALMDELIYNTKIILKDIVLKNAVEADENETELSIEQSDYLLAIDNGSMMINFFPLTEELLTKYGFTTLQAKLILKDRSQIPEKDRDKLLEFCNKEFMNNYVEYNNYYRALNGLPKYGTTEYDVYVDRNNEKLIDDDGNSEFNFDIPIHQYTKPQIDTLESLGIIAELREIYTGSNYRYLDFLGSKKVDIITARKAENWDILYIPHVESLVLDRFKELYKINRDIYLRRTYQEAYKYQSDYYDEMMMIMIISQTFSDLITEIPEWYIRRDVFDLRTVQYFLESQGVKFFKQIPLKYQIRIVKNLNKLIKYKSTNKNISDIIELFSIEGTKVYKYFLYKKYLYTTHKQIDITPPKPTIWEMEDEYDFGDEDEFEDPIDTTGAEILDFLYEDEEDFDSSLELHLYDFINESADVADSTEETDRKEEVEEEKKIIIDEYGNVFDLEFIRVPMGESYDEYINNNMYKDDYDSVTYLDQHWDGEDTHALIRNNHLSKDFTIEGTKYMFLDYSVSMSEYLYQIAYFMSMIFSSKIDTSDVQIGVPTIKPNTMFNVSDLCILLYCLSIGFTGKETGIKEPKFRTGKKPEFEAYLDVNGGMFYDGDEPYIPPAPEPEPEWEMEDEYDFGDEAVDTNIYDPLFGELFDFGFNYTLDPSLELHSYDFGDEKVNPYDNIIQVQPNKRGWVLGNLYDFLSSEPDYVEPVKDNYVGDNPDYDYLDMGEEENFELNEYSKDYDFRAEEFIYRDYVEPEEIYEEPTENWWDGLEHPFEIEVDGQTVKINSRYRWNIDGGSNVRYTELNQESFYDWMRTDHSNWFVPLCGRIYGFNLGVDLKALEKEINTRHSAFGFEKGYTLADFGVDSFDNRTTIESIDDLLQVYRNNTIAYKNIEKLIEDGPDTRDQLVTLNYVFNTLFTIPFDKDFYRLKSGQIAQSYDQILAEKNYTLYKYYKDIMKESDEEIRRDNIREALNDIVNTLEYYLSSDDTKFIFSFVPTNSLEAITGYIQLMINFFKSWKVYFLDPHVTYILDDKKENKVGNGDMIVERRVSTWRNDQLSVTDACQIKAIHGVEEYNSSANHEIIDIYAYYQGLANEDLNFDGYYPDADDMTNIDLSEFDFVNGGESIDTAIIKLLVLNNGSSLVDTKIVAILDGGKAVNLTDIKPEVLVEGLPTIIKFTDVNGGEPELLKSAPFVMVNGGVIGSRKRLWDLDGGGTMNMQEYLDIDGLDVDDFRKTYPITNTFEVVNYDVDGGGVDSKVTDSISINTRIQNQVITNDIKISKYTTNDLELKDDGLYLGGEFASQDEFEDLKYKLTADRYNYKNELDQYISQVKMVTNEDILDQTIDSIYMKYFLNTESVLKDYRRNDTLNYCISYVDSAVSDLKDWFRELNVFGWDYF